MTQASPIHPTTSTFAPAQAGSEVHRRAGSNAIRPGPSAYLRPRSGRPAFTLVELVLTIALLAVFAAVLTPVLHGTIRTLTAPPPAAAAARLDAAVDALRRDVWSAVTLAAASPHELTVTGPAGRAVTWHVGPGPRLDRVDGPASQHWPDRFPDATVAIDGAAVRLTLADAPGFGGGTVILTDQLALFRGTP